MTVVIRVVTMFVERHIDQINLVQLLITYFSKMATEAFESRRQKPS
jgi:hypothetical protein